ncbi:MAG: hypothetical protein ACRDMV_25075, partial [Streptosporangiales bacterium]
HTDPGSAFPWDHFMALVHGSTPEVDDVGHVDSISDKAARDIALALANLDAIEIPDELHAAHKGNTTWRVKLGLRGAWQQAYTGRRYAKANNGLLKNIAKQVGVDEQAIVAGVLEGLDPTAIAEAIPGDMAEQVVDILAQRLQS